MRFAIVIGVDPGRMGVVLCRCAVGLSRRRQESLTRVVDSCRVTLVRRLASLQRSCRVMSCHVINKSC